MSKAKTIIATLFVTAMFLSALPTIPVEANSIAEGPWTTVLSDPEELGGWADLKALDAKMDEGNLTFKVEYYDNMSDWGEGSADFRLSYIMLDADQDNTTGYTMPYYGGIDYIMYYYWGFQPSSGMPPEWGSVWCMLLRWNEAIPDWEGVMMLGVSTPRNDTAYITAPLESLGYPTAVDVFVWTGIMGDGGQGPMGNFMDMIMQTWNYTSGVSPHSITVDGDPADWAGITSMVNDTDDRDTYRFIDVKDFYMTDNSTHFFFMVNTTLPPVTTLQNESADLIYQHIVAFDTDQDNTTGLLSSYVVPGTNLGLDVALMAGIHVNSSIGWEGLAQGGFIYPNGTMYNTFAFDAAVNDTCEFSVPMDLINETSGTGIDGLFYLSTGVFYDWMPQEGCGTFTLPPYLMVDVRATLSWWDTAVVTARVTNQTIPILDAIVTANVTLPDDTVLGPIALYDDGTHGDPVADDANYTNTFPITQMGSYNVKVYAIKDTTDGTGYQTLKTISPQDAASFIASCQNPDGGFSERDVKATGLAVEALSSLSALDQINGNKTTGWIAGHQQPGGDFGGPYRTYWTVKALQSLGGLGDIDKNAAINSLVDQQRLKDVGPEEYGGWGDLQETCRAIIALKILGGLGHPDLNLTAAKEFMKIRQKSDGGFCNWPGDESWMWETSMAVRALKALNATAEINQTQAIDWLASCQFPDGGFSRRPGEEPNVEATYHALQALKDLGGLGSVNSTKAGEWLVGCQRPDGGFNNPWNTLSDIESSCWAIEALEILGNLSLINRDEAVQFIMNYHDFPSGCFKRDTEAQKTLDAVQALCLLGALDEIDWRATADYLASCQFPDGGFCSNPSQGNPDVSSTFYAVSALDLVGRLDTVNKTRAIYYLVVRQKPNGGFVDWYGDDPDVERTSYAVQALDVLGGLDKINITQAIAWLASCQNPDGGFGWMPGGGSEPWCTYLAVRALEILGGLSDINVTRVIEYLASQQDSWSGAFWGDVRSTYAALHTLSILGALDSVDAQLAADYLIRCQNLDGGFGEWDRDTWSYLENTYHCILGIQLVFGLPAGDIMPPEINILSPQNTTYSTSSVPLAFTINEVSSWIGYCLDGQANVTITGNTTLTGLPDGQHSIIVYANDTAGNMGYSDTVYFTIDVTPPTIDTPTRVPTGDVMPYKNVTVSVNVTDMTSGVDTDRVILSYHNGTAWNNVTMNYNSTTMLYEGTIPGQPAGTNVQYKITAYDNAGNVAVEEYELAYYAYTVVPEFPLAMLLPLLMFATLVAVILAKNRRQENP